MDDLSPSDLKTILHSKRANMYYLEYCRMMQKDGRVLYLTEADKENLYFNIPIANTTVLMLGNGTSITQAAMRMLSQAGVLVGFCCGGTPLHMACEVEWFTPQSEYRPTEYLQGWLSFWFDDQNGKMPKRTFGLSSRPHRQLRKTITRSPAIPAKAGIHSATDAKCLSERSMITVY